jgi:chromosome segregation ATPase
MTVSEILEGKSICIRLGEQPVLHRRLLGGAETVAWVSPAELLATMEAAFDSARAGVARLAGAADAEAALRQRLAGQVSELQRRQLPNADALAARLAASASPDRLSALAALEALQPEVERALQAADQAAHALAAARAQLQDLQRREMEALQMTARAQACVAGILPAGPADQARELPGWLDRLERKLAAGQLPAFSAGMANWMALAHHVQAGWQTMTEAAGKAIDERDELRGRFGALAAKHTARTTQGDDATLVALAGAAKAALFGGKVELGSARARLGEYEAALAHKHARPV